MMNGTATSDYTGCTGSLPILAARLWSPPGLNGGNPQFKFCYANVSVQTQLTGGPYGASQINATYELLQSLVLPNGTAWTFQYDNGNWGNLTQVMRPTGGTISYTWQTPGTICSSGTYPSQSAQLLTRTINANDGSGNHQWQYNLAVQGSYVWTMTVIDPALNSATHTLTGLSGSCSVYETMAQYYQTGSLLKTVQTDYLLGSTDPNDPNGVTRVGIHPIRVTTTWPSNAVSKTETDYDPGFSFEGVMSGSPVTVPYGKSIAQRDYDYGNGSPGSLLRQTRPTYMAFSGPNASSYLANHLLSLLYTVQTLDGSGVQKAFSQYNYDESSRAASGLTSSYQWDSAPPAGAYRGNSTSIYRWLNSGSLTCQSGSSAGSGSNLISRWTYFDDGNVQTSADPCGNGTTSSYSLNYWAAFPTTVTNALNQSTNNTFDFNTGLLTLTADPNNLTTSFSYDNMLRLAQVNHPDGAVDTITRQETSFPFTSRLNKQINSSQTEATTNVFDGLGRITQTQLNSDPQGVVYTDTTYDALGRAATVSNPHRTCGTDITSSCG